MMRGIVIRWTGDHLALARTCFDRVGDQVTRGCAGIDAEARDPPGMFMIEHHSGALLVGPVEGLRAGAGIVGCVRDRAGRLPAQAVIVFPVTELNHMSGT